MTRHVTRDVARHEPDHEPDKEPDQGHPKEPGTPSGKRSGPEAPRSQPRGSRLRGRLTALQRALAEGDQDSIDFHLDNVMRGVERLAQAWADGDLVAVEDEAWSPMQPAQRVPLRPEQRTALRATGADDALIDELQSREMWKNELYTVMVTRHPEGWVQELSIRRNDRKPVHDWRHFQRIKTEIAGPEVEAAEIYPRESRLRDTANQYYLYCLPPGRDFPFGYVGARILIDADDQPQTGAVQRRLPPDWARTPAE